MCGISGFNRQNENAIKKMVAGQRHRGPDDQGFFVDEKVSLGHNRLAIIDLSPGGRQPMISSDGSVQLIYNGEIYNYQSLKKELLSLGYVFNSQSDTEVILNGYLAWGLKVLEKLRGMWALAIYDRKKNQLILSRDFFGVKPLVYYLDGEQLIFASEIKTLIGQLKGLELNREAYAFYFGLGYWPAPATYLKNVYQLLPGQILIYDFKNRQANFQTLDFFGPPARAKYLSDEKVLLEKLEEVLTDSMAAHFVADVPVALLLSGGTDSALLAVLAKKAGFNPLAFNLEIFGKTDSTYARAIAQKTGLTLKPLILEKAKMDRLSEEVWELLDEPFADTAIFPTTVLFSQVAQEAKVVLSGEGGDELFGGYLRQRQYLGKIWRGKSGPMVEVLNQLAAGENLFSQSIINPFLKRCSALSPDLVNQYLETTALAHLPNLRPALSGFLRKFYKSYPAEAHKNLPLFFDRYLYLPNDLMYKGDISAMHFSLEVRVPFVDKMVWQFANRFISPEHCFSKKYQGKYLLKQILLKYLPADLVFRKKEGLSFPLLQYLTDKMFAQLKAAIDFTLTEAGDLGLKPTLLRRLKNDGYLKLFIKKYPRFVFALLANYKILEKYKNHLNLTK